MVFHMDLYRKCDFVCEGCVEFHYDRRRQEMLGIQEIVSIEDYYMTNSYRPGIKKFDWLKAGL